MEHMKTFQNQKTYQQIVEDISSNVHYLEIFQMRRGYEQTAVDLASREATREELDEMRDLLERMDRAEDVAESAALDKAFHDTIMKAAHNRLLMVYSSMLADLQEKFILDMRAQILADEEKTRTLREAHWEIYQALVDHDFAAGHDAMRKHFGVVGQQLEESKEKFKNEMPRI